MKTATPKMRCFSHISLIILSVLLYILRPGGAGAYVQATYADSAHGDATYGVKRSGTPADESLYHIGSCAHCHDIFDSDICMNDVNGLFLFAPNNPTSQTDNFCFQCHQGTGSVQVGGLTNNDYGSEFGGGLPNSTNIKEAFVTWYTGGEETSGSSHNLEKMRNWAKQYDTGDWITNDTNACLVCHAQHLSQKNHDPYPGSPPYRTAVRRTDDPSSGRGMPGNLWGDELGSDAGDEIMDEWAVGHYQAPYHGSPGDPVLGPFEPANDGTSDGSNLPNFAWFCYNCHRVRIGDAWTDANIPVRDGQGLWAVRWIYTDASNDQHGGYSDGPSNEGHVIAPYTSDYNHVMSCTDCHEPHGSPLPFLLRTCVNGKDGITVSIQSGEEDWGHLCLYEFCTACHVVYTQNSDPPANHYHSTFTTEQAPNIDCTSNGGCHGHAGAF